MPEFRFEDATDVQKTQAKNTYKQLNVFRDFQNKASLPLFTYLFKERGEHLFVEVFVRKSNRNLLDFFNRVDADIHEIIIMNVLFNESLYAHNFLYE